jgi:hypothetical protein
MADPLADQLDERAPTVDTEAAHGAFPARRRYERRRRRWIAGGIAAIVVVIGGVGVALVRLADDDRSTVATSNSSPTATPTSTVTPSTTPTTASGAPVSLLAVAGCPDIAASDLRATAPNLFGRATPDGLSIQAIATPAGVDGPYAVVLRYRSAPRPPTFGDVVDVNGHEARLFIGAQRQGQISWILDDGSEAYLRSRHLSADDLVAIARALVPRPVAAPIVGFDLAADAPGGFHLGAETTAPFAARSASTACHRVDGHDLRVGVIDAHPAIQYALGTDHLPLPVVQQRGSLMAFAVSNDLATAATALGVAPPRT